MTFTILIVIGAMVGWFLPRLMGDECYGVPVDLGVAAGSALLGGLILNAAVGGWIAGAIAAALFASGSLMAMRQVKKVRDKQQAAVVASRAASRRMRSTGAR